MNIVVLLAGGNGSRMECAEIPKQYMRIKGKTILEHSVDAFAASPLIDAVLLVTGKYYQDLGRELAARCTKDCWCIPGGETRSLSAQAGISFIGRQCDPSASDKVVVSDGVRPCILQHEIQGLLDALERYDCATTGIECYETILKSADSGEAVDIISRSHLFRQTAPEAYRYVQLERLYLQKPQSEVERYENIGLDYLRAEGYTVGIVPSTSLNFKVTRREDILLLESVLASGLLDEFSRLYEQVYSRFRQESEAAEQITPR